MFVFRIKSVIFNQTIPIQSQLPGLGINQELSSLTFLPITGYNIIYFTAIKSTNMIQIKNAAVDTDMAPGEIEFESVDQITAIESEFYDPKLLLKIYQEL
jgi:hypothetical protein